MLALVAAGGVGGGGSGLGESVVPALCVDSSTQPLLIVKRRLCVTDSESLC